MNLKTILLAAITLILFSFSGGNRTIEFKYPKEKSAKFTMDTDAFKKFSEEWRGEDYYYMSEKGKNGMICSVLFYKLNAAEQKRMVDPFGEGMAGIPFAYFSESSKLKKYESNNASWGEMKDDFMFRQNDIMEMEGMKIGQKHMYAYAMFGKDLFVNVHLSKVLCTPEDSTAMRQILAGLKKNK